MLALPSAIVVRMKHCHSIEFIVIGVLIINLTGCSTSNAPSLPNTPSGGSGAGSPINSGVILMTETSNSHEASVDVHTQAEREVARRNQEAHILAEEAERERIRQEHEAKKSVAPLPYSIIVPRETLWKAQQYIEELASGTKKPGALLKRKLDQVDELTPHILLGLLFDTKPPKIFAESGIHGDGQDWNLDELGLLGDVSVAVPVTIYDDGKHENPSVHAEPFSGTLVYTPGALLENGFGNTPVDLLEVTNGDSFNDEGYYRLYLRRLLPVLRFINEDAAEPRKAIVTVPGLGCGMFAGRFQGQLGSELATVLNRLLTVFGDELPNIKAVYFDPYNEHKNYRLEINGISFMIRPLTKGNANKPQLARPVDLQDLGDDFSNTKLYSIVAWDHVSWPGNDFYGGARKTDDGVKAAATDSMFRLTGVEGKYDPSLFKYQPPAPYAKWEQVVHQRQLRLWNDKLIWTNRE